MTHYRVRGGPIETTYCECMILVRRKREDHTLSCAHALVKRLREHGGGGAQTKYICSRVSWRAWERSSYTEEVDVWRDGRGKGYAFRQEKDWMGRLEEDLTEGVRHQVRRVARDYSEGRQMVSMGRGRGGGLRAEIA